MDHADVTRIVVTRSDGTLVGLFFDAAWSLTAVLVVVLTVTYAVVAGAQSFASAPVASGIAATIMLPSLRFLEVMHPRWPAAVTFRPAFWLLVPGSLGLVAITEVSSADGPDSGQTLLVGVVATVVAIAVGVQIGAVLGSLIRPRPRPGGGRDRIEGQQLSG